MTGPNSHDLNRGRTHYTTPYIIADTSLGRVAYSDVVKDVLSMRETLWLGRYLK